MTAAFRLNWAIAGDEQLKKEYNRLMSRLRQSPDGSSEPMKSEELALVRDILREIERDNARTAQVRVKPRPREPKTRKTRRAGR